MNVPGIALHQTAETQLDTFLAAPPHAVLLSGPAGTGKAHVAASLAAQLLGTTEPALENQAYYRVVTPQKGVITIEQIRELTNFFRLKVPGKAAVKRVCVLQDADTMGLEAQNALLKLLEEPPEGSVLILTSSRPQQLLPTIRSRARLLNLPVPTAEVLQKHFTEQGHEESAVISALLRSGTNVAEAERLLSDKSDEPGDTFALVRQALAGTSYSRLLLVDGLAKQKTAAGEFVDALAIVAMASLEAAATKGASSMQRWRSILEAVSVAQGAFEGNGNPKLVLTELMLAL